MCLEGGGGAAVKIKTIFDLILFIEKWVMLIKTLDKKKT